MSERDRQEHMGTSHPGVPRPVETPHPGVTQAVETPHPGGTQPVETPQATPEGPPPTGHAARTRSAASRAAAVWHYLERRSSDDKHEDKHEGETAGDDKHEGEAVKKEIVWKAAHAARVSAQAVAVLSTDASTPAADSRCARNASASAAQAAQMGRLHDGADELSTAACQAAVEASRAAADAAGTGALGEDETLNARSDEAEAAAVAAAERAGWMRPGRHVPPVPTGMRSPELLSMMHL
ncbi:hypothetical protein ACFVXW_01905 [Streptomyces sp. NPDC058251]|uniref:hypothetical protein n=1 Tax=Streptomyces sp. NPDC058251 TaxID=3346404 RepID=UPI0036ED60B9